MHILRKATTMTQLTALLAVNLIASTATGIMILVTYLLGRRWLEAQDLRIANIERTIFKRKQKIE